MCLYMISFLLLFFSYAVSKRILIHLPHRLNYSYAYKAQFVAFICIQKDSVLSILVVLEF